MKTKEISDCRLVLDVREVSTTLDEAYKESPMIEAGTIWVAPGKGSTWRVLSEAFNSIPRKYGIRPILRSEEKTTLLLTGSPIQPYDRARWESGNVE